MKDSAVQESHPPRPPPQRGTKTKNGCRTCKIRRIKCDEARPRCMRCLKTGRNCDGYANDVQPVVAKTILPASVGLYPTLSEPDVRAFDYFKQKALLGLMGFDYKSDFWTRTVPQLSEASPAVHRAALALSARHEHIYNNYRALRASESDLQTLKQYNRSIRQLCFSEQGQPIHVTLTCCILFICLENLAGNSRIAQSHLSNGLRVLKDWHSQKVSISEQHLREQITLIFCRFDMQATALSATRAPELDPSFLGGHLIKYQQIPKSFSSIYAAQTALERLELRLLYVLSTYSFSNPPEWSDDGYLQAKINSLQELRMGFSNWRRTFDDFCVKHSQTMDTKNLQLSVLLSLHHQTTTLMLDIKYNSGSDPGTTVTENHRFTTINNLARSLIKSAANNGATFSADMGVIPPVFFVAMGAPDRNIRRDSIQLLKMVKDREGFWNAATTAKIAESVLALEGAGALATVEVQMEPLEDDEVIIESDKPASRARIR